jgi:hypothetical protein
LAGGGGGGATPQSPRLSPHNLACLQALVAAALFLAGTLGSSWFAVLEALQNADYVLTIPGTAPPGLAPLDIDAVAGTPSERGGTWIEGQVNSNNRHQVATHPLLADVDSESVHVIQRLLNASIMLEDFAFLEFVGALCKLSSEMVSMQSGVDVAAGMGTSREGVFDVGEDDIRT